MNVNELTEEQKGTMIVEERYTFFQIENKLRQLVTEGMDAMKMRISKEADLIRKVQIMAQDAKRDVTTFEPRLERALAIGNRVDKIMSELT